MELTGKTKEELATGLKRAQAALARTREQARAAVGNVVQSMEVGSTSFALGFINGRYGGVEWFGVPLELIVAGGAHGLAFMGAPQADDLHNMGDGALACWAATLGAGLGNEQAVKAGEPTATAGALHMGQPTALDPALARLASF